MDYDRDGKLDIAIANYVDFDPKTSPLPGGQPSGHYCFSTIAGDFDGDGWPDIFIACDSTPNILQHNNKDGTFTDIAIPSGTAFNDSGEEQGSMGADAGDYAHTGRQGLVVTTFDDDVPALFQNEADGSFDDVYLTAGLGGRTHQVGWGAAFLDLDNNGWLDILMANGHVYPNVDQLHRESHYAEEKALYYNLGNGRFANITNQSGPATAKPTVARGMAYGDFLNDGSLAVVINNLDAQPNSLVNRGKKGNWLTIKLIGTIGNRDAIGAQVTMRVGSLVQMAEVRSGCCYMSRSDNSFIFSTQQGRIYVCSRKSNRVADSPGPTHSAHN